MKPKFVVATDLQKATKLDLEIALFRARPFLSNNDSSQNTPFNFKTVSAR